MKPDKVTIAHCWAQKRVNKVANDMLSKYTVVLRLTDQC